MEYFNNFVINFLEENDLGDYKEDWLSTENQNKLHNINDKMNKKSKKSKSLNGIKRNRSAYLLFCMDERKKLISELPPKEIMSHLAIMWDEVKNNNPAIIEKYNNLAKKDKERYDREKAEYE